MKLWSEQKTQEFQKEDNSETESDDSFPCQRKSLGCQYLDDECKVGEKDSGEVAKVCPPYPFRFRTRIRQPPIGQNQSHEDIMNEVQDGCREILRQANDVVDLTDSTASASSSSDDSLIDFIDDRSVSQLSIESLSDD